MGTYSLTCFKLPMARHCFWCCLGLIFLAAAVAPQAFQTPSLVTISIASTPFVIDPAHIVLAGTTVSAGGPAVTIDGVIVSEDSEEDVFVDGVEVLTGSIGIVQPTSSSFPHSSFQSDPHYIDVSSDEMLRRRSKAPRVQNPTT